MGRREPGSFGALSLHARPLVLALAAIAVACAGPSSTPPPAADSVGDPALRGAAPLRGIGDVGDPALRGAAPLRGIGDVGDPALPDVAARLAPYMPALGTTLRMAATEKRFATIALPHRAN